MCAILGLFHYANRSVPVTASLLTRLRDTMCHRGPDDAGVWVNAAGTVGLAHRRLSILDLSANGRQPMENEDGTVRISFNGEIYNHLDLRPWLEQRGHRFRSRSDTEVILHVYEEMGSECVHRLDGMFAFGLWDERTHSWFLARDRLGVKPLYYTQQQGMLLFASEIKALVAHPLIARDLDTEALGHYLTFKTTPAPMTLFAGIRKLPPGHTLSCDSRGRLAVNRYWDPVSAASPPADRCNEQEAVARVRNLLSAAVAKRMDADVPVGLFLSGGLDSSAILGLMAARTSRPINTFSIGIKDLQGYNEFSYAREVSRRFATNHHEVEIGSREVEEYLPQLVYHQDEPLADPVCVPLFHLTRLAAEAGTPVVLVGEGSDEQFLGYDSRIAFLRRYLRYWRPLLSLPRPAIQVAHALAAALARWTGRGARYEKVLVRAARGEEVFWGSVGFGDHAKRSILAGTSDAAPSQAVLEEVMSYLRSQWPRTDIAARMMYLDLKIRLAELLLMRVDKVTMSLGIEAREPYMDYRLIEYTMTLPRRLKLKNWDAKYLLKRATEDLVPASVIRRPKQAFAAPIGAWLRNGLGAFAKDVILRSSLRRRDVLRFHVIEQMLDRHRRGEVDHGVQIWTLMNLAAWYDCWIDGSCPYYSYGGLQAAALQPCTTEPRP